MRLSSFLKDQFPLIFLALFCALGVSAILLVLRMGLDITIFVACFILLCCAGGLGFNFHRRRHFFDELEVVVNDPFLTPYVSDLIDGPDFIEGRLTYKALQAVGKVAIDNVAFHKRQAAAYREYIELWIHEIKTPIAAAHLMAAQMHGSEAAKLKAEFDRIEIFVEQALYYARSTSLEQDYAIREISLSRLLREVCVKHGHFLIEHHTTPVFELGDEIHVLSDGAWLKFVIGQLVVNAAKYGASTIRFSAEVKEANTSHAHTVLCVSDDGKGIMSSDVPRVFERGFTGENGRALGSATGMGLYLVANLCEKMGLGVGLASEWGKGTRVSISFPHDRRRMEATRPNLSET